MKDHAPELPALQHWRQTLLPAPTFNHQLWKAAYPPLVPNKFGNINWKIIHRILPTAQSLYRMTVYATPNCHRCGFTESIDHLLLRCPNNTSFWLQIQQYTDKLTENRVKLSNIMKLFGHLCCKDDHLSNSTVTYRHEISTYCILLCIRIYK